MDESGGRPSSVARRRVLIIDDDIELHSFLTMVLEGQEYLVFSAISAAHGLDLLDIVEPDVVLLDAEIPGADPLELARVIHQLRFEPAVMVLADRSPNEADWHLATDAGVGDILEKPFEVEDFLGRIAKMAVFRKEIPLH